ncbi:MAG: putative cysteine dioxygenase [Friedmanniella sp.]|jgi:predicted metal-dependent enzyme (double-stranded beta helix superfamily)|nr:putative cysteine dioxygenase [Friedmanniella sp.]
MPASRRPRTPIDLAATALRLADQRALWEPLVQFDPVSRFYARLAAQPDFEVWLLTWVPGQGTDWHDHGGSAGAFVVLTGALTEEHARVRPDRLPTIEPRARTLSAGALRPFGTQHLHRVRNDGLAPAVSLHVYSPALVRMNRYALEGTELHLVETERAGASW